MKKICLIFLFSFVTHAIHSQDFFKTTEEYLDNTVEKTQFDRSKIVIEDFINIDGFADDVVNNKLFTFYGIAYNDEIFSAAQMENPSCWGQFRDLCQRINVGDSNVNNRKIIDISYIRNINFDKDKKTVIFIYGSDLTKRNIKNHITPILEQIQKDPSFDYIVLSLDYPVIKKH
ncbi:hypothetical protein GN157_02450 [Flavobacterium rakeshii]|uniref:Uncharacterized protein n=1 Tax=Flavobacterium rakeshii TaxID=1038845 RepID=A0A6N8H7H7_9FLAO|nr:hypothetical protein [Flavobacterium rakeshii]MUV02559.1 hypothetical protein [Flavobacterium rakeshii]